MIYIVYYFSKVFVIVIYDSMSKIFAIINWSKKKERAILICIKNVEWKPIIMDSSNERDYMNALFCNLYAFILPTHLYRDAYQLQYSLKGVGVSICYF